MFQPGEGLYLVGDAMGIPGEPKDFTGSFSRELLCYWHNPQNYHAGLPKDVSRIPERRFWICFPMLPEHDPNKAIAPLVDRLSPVATEKIRKLPDNHKGGAALLFERKDAGGS